MNCIARRTVSTTALIARKAIMPRRCMMTSRATLAPINVFGTQTRNLDILTKDILKKDKMNDEDLDYLVFMHAHSTRIMLDCINDLEKKLIIATEKQEMEDIKEQIIKIENRISQLSFDKERLMEINNDPSVEFALSLKLDMYFEDNREAQLLAENSKHAKECVKFATQFVTERTDELENID